MQLLIVEDNVPDAELTVRQLRAAGIDCTWTRVATEDAFRDALLSAPDLIISDCTLPAFDGISAFSIAAAETPDIPFVFVSGTLGDERAREALKHGAAGYVAKGNREELAWTVRSEEHTSELQSQSNLVCRLLLDKNTNHNRAAPAMPR